MDRWSCLWWSSTACFSSLPRRFPNNNLITTQQNKRPSRRPALLRLHHFSGNTHHYQPTHQALSTHTRTRTRTRTLKDTQTRTRTKQRHTDSSPPPHTTAGNATTSGMASQKCVFLRVHHGGFARVQPRCVCVCARMCLGYTRCTCIPVLQPTTSNTFDMHVHRV